jgi:hypothetical protein
VGARSYVSESLSVLYKLCQALFRRFSLFRRRSFITPDPAKSGNLTRQTSLEQAPFSMKPFLAGDRDLAVSQALEKRGRSFGRSAGQDRSTGFHPREESLIRLLDGEIDERSQAPVEAHLSICEPCRNKRDQLRGAMQCFVEFEAILMQEAKLSQSSTAPRATWGLRSEAI